MMDVRWRHQSHSTFLHVFAVADEKWKTCMNYCAVHAPNANSINYILCAPAASPLTPSRRSTSHTFRLGIEDALGCSIRASLRGKETTGKTVWVNSAVSAQSRLNRSNEDSHLIIVFYLEYIFVHIKFPHDRRRYENNGISFNNKIVNSRFLLSPCYCYCHSSLLVFPAERNRRDAIAYLFDDD